MLGIGIIGCGAIAARRHAPEYARARDCRLVGMYDPNLARARELAAAYGAKAYATQEELLADPAIGAVSVCTANDTHAAVSIAALRAGKHVLCEKPMAVNVRQAQDMIDEAKRAGKILMVAHNQRLDPAHALAKQLLASGELGKVLSFQTAFSHAGPEHWLGESKAGDVWFFRADRSSFGVLGDLGVHKIDLLCWLLDDDIQEVCAFPATLDKHFADGAPIDVEDNAAVILRFCSGAVGTMLVSWTSYGAEDNATVLNCQRGVLKLYRDGAALSVTRPDGTVRDLHPRADGDPGSSGVIDLFLRGIRAGASPIPGQDGLRVLRIMERCLTAPSAGPV